MEKVTIQKIINVSKDSYGVAMKYFKVLSDVNDLDLKNRELEVLGFAAVKGNISDAQLRSEFCSGYDTSVATLNNITSKMRKMGLMVKEDKTIKLAPVVNIDFNKQLILEITLKY